MVVVEDDPFPRLIQVILDPAVSAERVAAFSHFFAHEEPDFTGWCVRLRAKLKGIHPAEVRLVPDQAGLLAALPGATAVVTESLTVGKQEIAAAGGMLRIVQKYGTVLSGIDTTTCGRASIRVLSLRRRANISCAEHAFGLMLALARKIHETAGLISVEQLQAAGYSPTQYDRAHTANANWARITGTRNLFGRQIGIVGFGEIGREVALRAAAFGMRIVYTQRRQLAKLEEARFGAAYAPLDELLATSDFVSLHLPFSDATRGIIGRRELGLDQGRNDPHQHLAPAAGGPRGLARGAALGPARRVRPRPPLRRAGSRRRSAARFPQRDRHAAYRRGAALQFTRRFRGAVARSRPRAAVLN